jgi:hypothetical protein
MKHRRALRLAAVAAWTLALAPLVPGTFGQETSGPRLDAQGWWNRTQDLPVQGSPTGIDDPTGNGLTTAPTVPAPATVPEDGLYVANDASGPSAIAAVRYLVGQAGGTLTLKLPDGTALTGTEDVVACPVLGGFTPAQNGRWDSAPAYDESACIVKGTPDDAGTAFTFDIPATFASSLGDISVVIVPAVGSTSVFSLPFAKPDDTSFTVTTPVQSPPAPPSTPAYEPGTAVYTAPAPSSSPSFSSPSAPTVAAPDTSGGGDAVAAPAPVALATPAAAKTPSRASQVAAVVTLLAIGAALWWLTSQPQRAPRLLGSVGGKATAEPVAVAAVRTVRPRGVGRFARHRDTAATPL